MLFIYLHSLVFSIQQVISDYAFSLLAVKTGVKTGGGGGSEGVFLENKLHVLVIVLN
jgi:hypothetical protein